MIYYTQPVSPSSTISIGTSNVMSQSLSCKQNDMCMQLSLARSLTSSYYSSSIRVIPIGRVRSINLFLRFECFEAECSPLLNFEVAA